MANKTKKSKNQRSNLKKSNFSKSNFLIFLILFGIAGGLVLYKSFAAASQDLPGDLNDDGVVSQGDITILAVNLNSSYAGADANNDGTVDFLDASVILSHFGETIQSYSIPTNIASNCSADVTTLITNWVASVPDNAILNFGSNKCYKIEGTLTFSNRTRLILDGKGSTFQSFTAPADQRPIWRVSDSTGVKFRNMTLTGSYSAPGTFNSSIQHAHGIDLRGTNIDIANVNINNVAGDCVYFGLSSNATTRSSGGFHDSICNGTGRNGVSLVAADNVLVQRVTTDIIGYETFDVEPNVGAGFGACHDRFDSNTINNFAQHAYSVVESAAICDQSFTNNHVVGPKGLKIAIGDPFGAGFRPNGITISGNTADSAATPTPINVDHVDNLIITGNTVPMTAAGYMAAVDGGCNITVSGNSFPGGGAELFIVNPVNSC